MTLIPIPDDMYDVRVTFTVGVLRHGEWPSIRDETEHVINAMIAGAEVKMLEAEYPKGTVRFIGGIDTRVLEAKDLLGAAWFAIMVATS